MGQRRFTAERCATCGLHRPLCACGLRPSLTLGTGLLVVQNNKERHKPTNTGRMITQVLAHAELVHYGARGAAWTAGEALTRADHDYFLLFPRVDDPEGPDPRPPPILTPEIAARRRLERPGATPTIVVLDGTWAQCSRMSRRVPELAAMSAWSLEPGPASHWGMRAASEPSRISSFEAAIRIVELFEGPEPALAMQVYFDEVVARMQFMKAKRASPEVPQEWVEARARRFGGGS